MKVAIFVDKYTTAIDRLAQMVKTHNPHLNIIVHAVHPKRNDPQTLEEAYRLLQWADVVDVHYWKSGEVLRQAFGEVFTSKPRILFHFNPYDVDKEKWQDLYDTVVVGNQEIHNNAPYAYFIPYAVDLAQFKFKDTYVDRDNKNVNMVVGRIESKKGVLEVAQACKELGYRLKLVGRISDMEYMRTVLATGSVDFLENGSEEQLLDAYYNSAVHVCNSTDNFESGTLPILEAMSCGVPVLTRSIGHVPDLNNGKNMIVRAGKKEDVEDLMNELKQLMENYEQREGIRERAFDTVRNYGSRRMAMKVAKLYYDLYLPEHALVSIIIPTKDNPEAFAKSLVAAASQDYPKKEIVVVDSGDIPVESLVNALQEQSNVVFKYIKFPHRNTYTLAEARNLGVIEASGSVLVFCDDRIAMEKEAVTEFATYIGPKTWLWGTKDGSAKGFVENFSCILREDLITGGMFCERMQWYGGMSQEVRTRFERKRGFEFIYIDKARANGIKRSKSKNHRRQNIIEAKFLLFKMYGE